MSFPLATRFDDEKPILTGEEAFQTLARGLLERLSGRLPGPQPRSKKARQAKESELLAAIETAARDLLGQDRCLIMLRTTDAELLPVVESVVGQIPDAVATRREGLSNSRIDALVDVYLANDPLSGFQAEVERDNAEARARFLEEVPTLSSDALAEMASHGAKNRSATANRWKSRGYIFSVPHRGRELYPAFQFSDGAPRPVIGKVLKALPPAMSPWQAAFWFWGGNGWLDGAAPMERLNDQAAVVEAARHEGETWAG